MEKICQEYRILGSEVDATDSGDEESDRHVSHALPWPFIYSVDGPWRVCLEFYNIHVGLINREFTACDAKSPGDFYFRT